MTNKGGGDVDGMVMSLARFIKSIIVIAF